MGDDVEMKDVSGPAVDEAKQLADEIDSSFVLLQKAAANYDNRYISMVFRDLGQLRRRLVNHRDVLVQAVSSVYGANPDRAYIYQALGATPPASSKDKDTVVAEVELYVHLLVQCFLLDTNQLDALAQFNEVLIKLMKVFNQRTLDFLQAKIWFYICRTHELRGDLESVRPELLTGLRTATLRHDSETTASILTLLLRNYLLSHDVAAAANLVDKTEFPENAGNALVARYYFYLARINAIQLDYSTAHEYVIAAIRKAPQTHLATGFVQAATKLQVVIELLMGDIPELQMFRAQAGNFEPYMQVTKAVRRGDLSQFNQVVSEYRDAFQRENNLTLVMRLRQNVIKTGIRIISLAYSKISLKDICIRLHLDSEESTEYIVSKAIRDGVIEASINHEKGYMQSKELLDVYSTEQPQQEFDQRIRFCLSLHNDSVKAMRYPSDTDHHAELEKDDREDEIDLLKAIEEGDLDDFMD
ncbi:26S proteasome regulatory subunit Rpn3p [Diutina catenulata]